MRWIPGLAGVSSWHRAIERFIRSFKDECIGRVLVSFHPRQFRGQVLAYLDWYARFRPHQGLDGRTPEELCDPTSRAPPAFAVSGPEAVKLDLVVTHHQNQPHLPIVELRKVA